MEKAKTLNQSCPFGNRSTRFFSSIGKAPDLLESREANMAIKRVLDRLSDEVKARNPDWQPEPLSTYDTIARTSHRISEHSPSSLSRIFPVSEERVVDFLFEKNIAPHNTTLSNALAVAYLDPKNAQENKKATVRHILGLLQKSFPDFVASGGTELDLSKSPAHRQPIKQGEGIDVSQEDFELLLNFQDLEERFESVENVRALNEHSFIKQIAEITLGIQMSVCKTLETLRKEDPQWFDDNYIAFEEIAILDEKGEIVPSSRLLKLVLHNVGEFLLKSTGTTPEAVLFNALQEALKHNVFHQKICIFEEVNGKIRFDGVVDKLCPARGALSQIIMNQLTNRMIKQ